MTAYNGMEQMMMRIRHIVHMTLKMNYQNPRLQYVNEFFPHKLVFLTQFQAFHGLIERVMLCMSLCLVFVLIKFVFTTA